MVWSIVINHLPLLKSEIMNIINDIDSQQIKH